MNTNDIKLFTPLTPDEILLERNKTNKVKLMIQAVNELLIENYGGISEVKILQDDLITRFQRISVKNNDACPPMSKEEIFKAHLLDIEPIFREFGWDVQYHKPGYGESFDKYFTFSKSKSSKVIIY